MPYQSGVWRAKACKYHKKYKSCGTKIQIMKTALTITRWTLAVILLLVSIVGFSEGDFAPAIISVIIALLLLPPVAAFLLKKQLKPAIANQPAIDAGTVTAFTPAQPASKEANVPVQIKAESKPVAETIQAAEPAKVVKKSGGLFGWLKGWGSAIKTAMTLEKCIKQFPNTNPATLNKLLQSKPKWSEGDTEAIRKRIIDKYDIKINADNVESLGQRYLDFYKTIFPGHDGQEIMYKISVSKVEAFLFTKVNDDEALDPSEIEEVITYSKRLNVTEFDSKEKIREDYDYYITNWELDNKVFKGIQSDFMLDKTELCIYKVEKCELVKRKSVTRSVSYGGASYRMKLGKGLSYRVGHTSVSTQKETIEVSEGYGLLNVTTKRILFKGKEGVVTINTNTIVDMEPFKDAVIIHKTTGKPISLNTADGLTLYKYLRSATRNKR